jgi:hypothetical protein
MKIFKKAEFISETIKKTKRNPSAYYWKLPVQ